jgi:hypothetical protein
MYRLVIKKTFFNMWDNVAKIIFINIIFLTVFFCALFLFESINVLSRPVLLAVLIFIFILLNLAAASVSFFTADIAGHRRPALRDLITYTKIVFTKSILTAVFISFFAVSVVIAILYYSSLKSFSGFVIVSLLFWICLIILFTMQYFYPVFAQLDKNPVRILARSFLIFFDNVLFSVFLFAGAFALFILSFFTAQLFPGMATVILWLNVGLKLRICKYEYLEKYPDADRNKIPWGTLLENEASYLKDRTLKNFIFPWK